MRQSLPRKEGKFASHCELRVPSAEAGGLPDAVGARDVAQGLGWGLAAPARLQGAGVTGHR